MKWIDKLFYKRLIDRITISICNNMHSLSMSGQITDDELEFIMSICKVSFDAGYSKGVEETCINVLKSTN